MSESESLLLLELEEFESLSFASEPRLRFLVVRPFPGGALVTEFKGNSRNSLLLYGLNIKRVILNQTSKTL